MRADATVLYVSRRTRFAVRRDGPVVFGRDPEPARATHAFSRVRRADDPALSGADVLVIRVNLVRGQGQGLARLYDPRLLAATLFRRHREVGVEVVERHDAEQEYQDDSEDDPPGAVGPRGWRKPMRSQVLRRDPLQSLLRPKLNGLLIRGDLRFGKTESAATCSKVAPPTRRSKMLSSISERFEAGPLPASGLLSSRSIGTYPLRAARWIASTMSLAPTVRTVTKRSVAGGGGGGRAKTASDLDPTRGDPRAPNRERTNY